MKSPRKNAAKMAWKRSSRNYKIFIDQVRRKSQPLRDPDTIIKEQGQRLVQDDRVVPNVAGSSWRWRRNGVCMEDYHEDLLGLDSKLYFSDVLRPEARFDTSWVFHADEEEVIINTQLDVCAKRRREMGWR